MATHRRAARVGALALVAIAVTFTIFGSAARATTAPVTYTATQTIPVPPASSYSGTGGGDGWAVALTPAAVYNVFHHNSSYEVACHKQSDALPCWPSNANDVVGQTVVVTDADESGFSTSGHAGLVLDHATGKLYGFATRNSTNTGGVVCFDTTLASPTVNPFADGAANPFCGFTELTGRNESVSGTSGLSEAVQIGTRMFAFNFSPGASVGPGAQNKLVCFDISTSGPCAGQPYTVDVGSGANGNGTFPAPGVARFGDHIVVPVTMGGVARLACFDASTLANCSGQWPVALGNNPSYPSSYGTAFPKLTASGELAGFCLPMPGVPCFTLSGESSASPPNMPSGVSSTGGWNGGAVVVGPRVYIPHGYYPNGGPDQIECYDYNLGAECPSPDPQSVVFPKTFGGVLGLLYTVNADPQRPDCLWVNSDSGKQIQNFDAYSGGRCGEGPTRVLASVSVVPKPVCTPGAWTSLQVTSPARNTYASGSVAFRDASNVPIAGVQDVSLDANGVADLRGLDLDRNGLPQFLITLDRSSGAAPESVSVKLTWTGTYDPSCTQPGTTVVNPPGGATAAPPVTPPKADVVVSMSAPTEQRTNGSVTFTTTVKDNGPDTATGVVVKTPVPTGAKLVSLTASAGNGCVGGAVATCYIGTLVKGQSAAVTMVLSSSTPTTLNPTSTAESDYDPDHSNNIAGASTVVLDPGSVPPPPPASAQPGTFNAVGTGTILINGVPHPADQQFVLNSGDVVDVTNGIITFTDSQGKYGSWGATRFVAAQRRTSSAKAPKLSVDTAPAGVSAKFQVDQPTTAGAVTTLTLVGGDFSVCSSPRRVAAKNQKPVQQLWGSAKGNFTTKGRFSAATVRGTIWMVQDRCDGTLTQVVEGVVDVFDSTLGKTVSVGPGQEYLALAPVTRAPFKPPLQTPAQTPKQVTKRGLVWGATVFKTRTTFERYLKASGYTWQQFATAYPKLAKALATRKNTHPKRKS